VMAPGSTAVEQTVTIERHRNTRNRAPAEPAIKRSGRYDSRTPQRQAVHN
jgi:hypothetical protein